MLKRLALSVHQAAATCMLVLSLGVPVAWELARLAFPGRALLLRLLMLPFVMPTLVAGVGVLALFGADGLLWRGWQDTPYLLLYGNVFFNLPVLVRAAYQGFVRCLRHCFRRHGRWVRGRSGGFGTLRCQLFAPGACWRRVPCLPVLFFRVRAGAAAGR